jgi:glycine/D-amino acid oxidase-like deaminating enzyme
VPRRLYVATGHGTLGVTFAPATAAALTELIIDRKPVELLHPFRLGRSF